MNSFTMRRRGMRLILCAWALAWSPFAAANLLGYADIFIEYFDSGNGTLSCPEGQGGVFPPPATTPTCVSFSVVLGDDPGPTSDYLSIPMGSFITVGFVDEVVIDGPGDDLFIAEVGDAGELAEIWISAAYSTDPADFIFLGTANGNTVSSFDLATIGFTGAVKAVKVLSLQNGGAPGAPGFDLAHVQAVNFAPVPLPAALWLLWGALGVLSLWRAGAPPLMDRISSESIANN